jgi:hypothetical protein
MISFQLRCSSDHEFEAWFRSSEGYEEQLASGDVVCPSCGDKKVTKALMAPSVASKKGKPSKHEVRAQEVAKEVLEAVGKMQDHVEKNCDYVGEKFADEARRIHYGETEERGIYGEATVEETKDLDEEGIEIFKVPTLPRRDS